MIVDKVLTELLWEIPRLLHGNVANVSFHDHDSCDYQETLHCWILLTLCYSPFSITGLDKRRVTYSWQ